MNAPASVARLAIIKGRVQGVWYRGWTCGEAQSRGLSGWVRNRRDGTVEALFYGPDAQVSDMLAACRIGPPAAKVMDIEIKSVEAPLESGFKQLATL